MLVLDKNNFETEVLRAAGLVIVDYWGPRCEPCLALMPEIEKLAEKYGQQVKFGKLNTAENRRLAISQQIFGLPTIAFYRGGQKIAELTGEVTVTGIEETLKKLLAEN